MKRLMLVVLAIFGFASAVSAQGVGVTAVNLRQYMVGATTPVSGPFTIPVANVTCNVVAGTQPQNSAWWDDPADTANPPTHVCQYVDPGTGPLFATVYGALEATLTNVAGTIEGPESNRAPFSRPPLAPTRVRVRKS